MVLNKMQDFFQLSKKMLEPLFLVLLTVSVPAFSNLLKDSQERIHQLLQKKTVERAMPTRSVTLTLAPE